MRIAFGEDGMMMMKMKYLVAAGLACVTAPCVAAADQATAPASMSPRLGQGYLKGGVMADSLALSPPPPAPGSASEARDREASAAGLALKGSARWSLATRDADLFGPGATGALSCALGVDISAKTTPRLDRLLRRTIADLGMSTSAIKHAFNRERPFTVNRQPTCTPDWESMLVKDGSYPSGHSAIGYGWGLILAELRPERAALLVARGRAFGDSRRICNAHWLSDIEEGRIAAAATVSRLNADPAFQKDLKGARAELKRAKAQPRDCDGERAALSLTPTP
ncbi:phosphatase PAP2 family protein [Sphingobium sp. H39-3-25]|uniref:acid phosphatase n=1 Tax=Sphingobium arseniciresistens TaxID=3030834 RepID=UPI0023B92E3E|nr:phosphatase PAP2 family protein [Sphingobium arseniciresistens]